MKYTDTHEWVILEKDNIAKVGLSSYAKEELGDIVYIEMPHVGSDIKAKDLVCVLESNKSALDFYSPVSGKILEINENLKKNPSKIYDKGEWLYKILLSNPKEYDSLMDEKVYRDHIDAFGE